MLFLIEMDHVKSGGTMTPEAGRAFIEQTILPTLDRAEQLAKDRMILAGGPVVGRIALRFIMEVESPQVADRIISSLPIWPLFETRVTPLTTFADRRDCVQNLLK